MNIRSYIRSSLFVLCSCFGTFLLFFVFQAIKKAQNKKYQIERIFLKGENGDFLTGDLVSEMLDLSISEPLSFFSFDVKQREEELKKIGIFRKIRLEKKRPDCLVVLYELYEPIALVLDQNNTLLNIEGKVMPYRPYFSPKKLVKVILGENLPWGEKIGEERWELLQKALTLDEKILQIDLRSSSEKKKQKKELVFEVARGDFTDWVRLNPASLLEEWKKYSSIQKLLPPLSQIVELRYQDMALFEKRM